MLPSKTRTYTLLGVAGTPQILAHLLHQLPRDSPQWDSRPDPDRFTLREILAHLVDFDEIGLHRLKRIVSEDTPELENWDEEAAVITGNYATSDPHANLSRLISHREVITEWLEERSPADWARTASHPQLGVFTLEDFVVLFLAHDAYHLQQVTEWLKQAD